jgi:hypothetical protein
VSARDLGLALTAMLLATPACAEQQALFPPETAGCYVGTITPAAGPLPSRKPAVPVTAVRLLRGYPELALEQEQAPRADGQRPIYLRIIVTFADAGKKGAQKRYANGRFGLMICSADMCDAGNYRVERQVDGTVLLRMTGGMTVGGDWERPNRSRRLPDTAVYRLTAGPMAACH